jgi:hypothetical protein
MSKELLSSLRDECIAQCHAAHRPAPAGAAAFALPSVDLSTLYGPLIESAIQAGLDYAVQAFGGTIQDAAAAHKDAILSLVSANVLDFASSLIDTLKGATAPTAPQTDPVATDPPTSDTTTGSATDATVSADAPSEAPPASDAGGN